MRYIIHSCPERMWYVQEFLIPSLMQQGIHNVDIYNDIDREGVLWTTMKSFREQSEDCWHLQDDILISKRFAQVTEYHYDLIVTGYCSAYILGKPAGIQNIRSIWYSAPCMYIPKRYANECAEWFYSDVIHNQKYTEWVTEGKYDDEFFKIYMIKHYPNAEVLQLKPNIVEHVDWLIGGSLINKDKKGLRRSKYWVEPELVTQLENSLREKNRL